MGRISGLPPAVIGDLRVVCAAGLSATVLLAPFDLSAQDQGRRAGLAGCSVLSDPNPLDARSHPALLALAPEQKSSAVLPSAGIALGNNAFSYRFLGQTFTAGRHLSEDDKNVLLSRLTQNRLHGFAALQVPVVGVVNRNFAFTFLQFHSVAHVVIPKDVFDLMFSGGDSSKVYRFNHLEEKNQFYWSSSLSTGKALRPFGPFSQLAVGATFRYVRGIIYGGLESSDGWFQVTADTLHAEGEFTYLTAWGGDGVGLDLSAAVVMPWGGRAALTAGNIVGNLIWRDASARTLYFQRHAGVHIDSVSYNSYWRNFFNQRDTTYHFGERPEPLPKALVLAYEHPRGLGTLRSRSFATLTFGLNRTSAQSTTPRLSLGQETAMGTKVKFRTGISWGGMEGFTVAGGLGYRWRQLNLDLGGAWMRGFLFAAKGFNMAFTTSTSL